ncbi:MAG: YcxB family protein [Chitinophagaceae bacterium]
MLQLTFHLSEEEFFEYNYYTAWSAPERKQYRLFYYLKVLFLYGGVTALYLFSNKEHQQLLDMAVFGAIALLYFLLIPFLIKRSIKKRARLLLEQPENKHILDECEVILMDTGITDKDKASESRYSWDAIVKKRETENCYYLYTNSYHAIVIPKRVLKTSGDNKELLRLMNEHLPLSADFAEKSSID